MLIIIVSLFSIYLGWVIFSEPEKTWEMRYQFFVKGGEPTSYAIFCIKFTGVVLILAGVGLIMLCILEIVSIVTS